MTQSVQPHVLIVSSHPTGTDKLRGLLEGLACTCTTAPHCAAARDCLARETFDLVFLLSPLPDGVGLALAQACVQTHQMAGGLFLARTGDYEEALATLTPHGILVLPRTASLSLVRQGVQLLLATRERLRTYAAQADRLRTQMEDEKRIHRAKLLLMERLHMREGEAHRYLERQAMDTGRKKRAVAEEILRIYEP